MTTGALQITCAKCGFASPTGFKFCGSCGQPFSALTPPPVPPAREEVSRADRRQITVLFCDLADSTPLSEALDPEELREVVRAYQAACAGPIERYEGHIAQYLGDGLLVYFGFPEAHEDDPQRSLHAALAMLQEMERLNAKLERERGIRLAVRIGIHTGPVVAGEVGAGERREHLAMGQTPNIAARLQGLAERDCIVLSGATYRLARGFFEFEPMGERVLKGVSAPVDVYRALRETGVRSRFEAEVHQGLSPLVGRQGELDALAALFESVREGHGKLALLVGEAGIGKSRLLHQFQERLLNQAHTWLVCRCAPFYRNTAFHPVVELLKRVFQWSDTDSPEKKLEALEERLRLLGLPLSSSVPLYAGLLSLPLGEAYPPLELSPQKQKQQTLESLLTLLLKQTESRPVVLVLEDLHWADPSTLELLRLLVERTRSAPLLMILTTRPPPDTSWEGVPSFTQLVLHGLSEGEVTRLVAGLTSGKALPPTVLKQVVQKTDGIPLFVEELTKMLLESGLMRETETAYELVGPLPSMAIPATLQDALMARLDRQGDVKELAQLCAVLGREFSFELLAAVSPFDEALLQRNLARLAEAELIFERTEADRSYIFKHALIQDAAYDSLLKSKRQDFHRRIAETLETQFPETAKRSPELLAHHFAGAGLTARAVQYLHQAGQLALSRSANLEAIHHLEKGLAMLETLPAGPERAARELPLQLTLGGAWSAARGYAAPQVERAFGRALAICEQMGDTPQLFWVCWGLWSFHIVRANLDQALELGRRCLRLAKLQEGTPLVRLAACEATGMAHYFRGELHEARELLLEAEQLDEANPGLPVVMLTGSFHGVSARCALALVHWHLDLPEEAVARERASLRRAEQLHHLNSQAFALTYAARLYDSMEDTPRLHQYSELAVSISQKLSNFFVTLATFFLGLARLKDAEAHEGEARVAGLREGQAQMRQGLDSYRALGARLSQTYMLARFVEYDLAQGRLDEARPRLAEALRAVESTGERYWEAELHRLTGELALAEGGPSAQAEAEAAFRRALETARSRGDKPFEHRATASLERLTRGQGLPPEQSRPGPGAPSGASPARGWRAP